MDALTFRDLVAGMDATYLCEFLQINPRTLQRWKEGTAKVPHSAILALRIKLDGDLSAIGGDAWKGFILTKDGRLYAPYFRGSFSPLQISALFFERQELHWLRLEVKQLTAALDESSTKLKKAQAEVWASDQIKRLQH